MQRSGRDVQSLQIAVSKDAVRNVSDWHSNLFQNFASWRNSQDAATGESAIPETTLFIHR
jgi:hypothetical protein